MEKIKRIVLCHVPTSLCNFRCHYCYLSHRSMAYQGEQANFLYPPDYVGKAFTKERLGGICYFNFCAEGETLLTKGLDEYIYEIVKQGHYAEIVTNMSISHEILDKILLWESALLEHVTFKCSFHYLELVKKGLLDFFVRNVKRVWEAGASANIEITPCDELISYLDEVKEFSMKHFGALPQITIARDDTTKNIEYLTKLPMEEYDKVWSMFDSPMWRFKKSIFRVKRNEYCYAGSWVLNVNIANGNANQCYRGQYSQNIYEDLSKPIDFVPIGTCAQPHCYNGHMFLTCGTIPGFTNVRYGSDIKDRIRTDGTHWLRPQICAFLDGKLYESNVLISSEEKRKYKYICMIQRTKRFVNKLLHLHRNPVRVINVIKRTYYTLKKNSF